jgi:putative oxidoreductase
VSLWQNFDPTNGLNLLRIVCGLWFIPHLWDKISGPQFALDWFDKTGFRPARAWLYAAIAVETLVTVGLVLGIQTRYAALLGAAFLFVATYGVYRFSNGSWLSKHGGMEYPLLWGFCCLALALMI